MGGGGIGGVTLTNPCNTNGDDVVSACLGGREVVEDGSLHISVTAFIRGRASRGKGPGGVSLGRSRVRLKVLGRLFCGIGCGGVPRDECQGLRGVG